MSACVRCSGQLEEGDLRCAICALPVPVQAPSDRHTRAQVLRCTDCNAAVAFVPDARAPKCGFCGATMTIEQPEDPIEAAELRIPFSVARADAEAALRGWLGRRGFFAPKELSREAVLESLTPLCWAGWFVQATAQVTWTADSDEGSHRSAWAPHAGQVPMTFDGILVPASRGLTHVECTMLAPYYDLARAVPVDAPTRSDEEPAMVEGFEAQRSAAREIVSRAIAATAKTKVEPHIPGRRFRNIHVACLLERQTTQRVALPAWVLAYRYRGNPYRAIVHGQRAEVVFGDSPKDWGKVMLVVGAAVLAVVAIVVIIALATGRL
ncbi:MAG TPA: hypothetical protein VM513_14050 [Kofleriaceae bacterium]|jgi:hypothetical protein|nr:hypothetical protein [Kofleriaceae bacterium]